MIHILTITIMIVVGTTFFAILRCLDNGDMVVSYEYDGLITTIAKVYIWVIIWSLILLFLFGISRLFAEGIMCSTSHNEYEYCEKENK